MAARASLTIDKCSVCNKADVTKKLDKCPHVFCSTCFEKIFISSQEDDDLPTCPVCSLAPIKKKAGRRFSVPPTLNSEYIRCPRHDKVRDIYCVDHKSLVCGVCADLKHTPRVCTCITAERARKSEQVTMKNLNKRRNEILFHLDATSKELDDKETALKQGYTTVNIKLDDIERRIETFYKKSTQEIRKFRESIKGKLHQTKMSNKRTKRVMKISQKDIPEPEVKSKWELGELIYVCDILRKDCARMQKELNRLSASKIATSMKFNEQEGLVKLLVSNYWSVGLLRVDHYTPNLPKFSSKASSSPLDSL